MARHLSSILLIGMSAAAQNPGTPPPLPPPGSLVDVGGWKLHLNCTGEVHPAQPTVILESGAGDFSVEWSLVQPKVAEFARVCSYDRAGDGWSELGPHPRTFHQIAYELHTLLANAGIKRPIVLVGHSYGGWLVRQYQAVYPSEVSGMVLVEPGMDNPWRITPATDGKLVRASDLATGQPVPEIKKSGPLRVSDLGPNLLKRMMAGTDELSKHANDPPRDLLPPDAQRMRTWALAQLGHIAAGVNPFENEEITVLHRERLNSNHALGDLPLIVLTRGILDETGPNAKSLEEDHRRDHEAQASMSRKGKLIVAGHSGHHIQLQEPELVAASIREVLSAKWVG
jgi:pimeloyl-ACP methyl ester carboxylesterase